MKGLDANTQKYELAEIDHNVVLFTNMRLDRDTVPEGIFCFIGKTACGALLN